MSGNLSERDVKGVKWELRPCLFSSWLSLNPLCGFLFYVLPVTCSLCGNLGNTSSKPLPWKGPVGLESQRTKPFLVQALGGRGVFTWLPLPDQVVRSRRIKTRIWPRGEVSRSRTRPSGCLLSGQMSYAGCSVIHPQSQELETEGVQLKP